jgi:hypothetical protein
LARSNHLDIIFEGFVSHLQSERIRLRTAYNVGSPINQLPAEILSEIFLLHVNQQDATREISLRNLAVVCSVWNGLVLRSPHLWTVLDAGLQNSKRFLIASVAKSKGLPLKVNTTEKWLSPDNRTILSSFAPQIQSLFYAGGNYEIIEDYLPTLRDLHVYYEDSDNIDINSMEGPPGLVIPAGVSFRSLILDEVYVTGCEWDRLKDLQVINLINFEFYDPFFTPLFLQSLATSAKLQMIVVHGLQWMHEADRSPTTDIPELHFPILHTISIKRAPISFTTALMKNISIPQCRSILLGDLKAQEISAWGWLIRALESQLQHASKLDIQVIKKGEGD